MGLCIGNDAADELTPTGAIDTHELEERRLAPWRNRKSCSSTSP